MENIPSHLFDLLKEKKFNELNAEQRSEILKYMSENEYNELYQGTYIGNILNFSKVEIGSNDSKKESLMQYLKENKREQYFINKPVSLWKAASILLLLMGSFYFILSKSLPKNSKIEYITLIDTVYKEKEVTIQKLIDTIYIIKNSQNKLEMGKNRTKNNFNPPQLVDNTTFPKTQYKESRLELNILQIKDFEKQTNHKNGKSIKDDSLFYKIGVVTL